MQLESMMLVELILAWKKALEADRFLSFEV